MAFMQTLLQFMQFFQYYLIMMLLVFLMIARLFRGLFSAYLEVKASGKKKILLNTIGTDGDNYFIAGKIIEDHLVFKFRKRDKVTNYIPLPEEEVIYTFGTVKCINIHEPTVSILTRDFRPVGRIDPNKTDSLLTRCLYRPSKDDSLLKAAILVSVLAVLVGGMALFYIYKDYKISLAILENTNQILRLITPPVLGA